MNLSKIGLLFVIFVDVAGQGLILPLINSLVMDPQSTLLPADTPLSTRHLNYGLIIGTFYLFWFFGAVYVSKLSDSIGRKNGILICLSGAFFGYVLTILSIILGSLWLMIIGRAISGFTSGNQPIAQAAMSDYSRNDEERTRNMGYCVTALSFGLVAGPLIAGVLSNTDIVGPIASLNLPFYFAIFLVLIATLLIVFFFEDTLAARAPLQIQPQEIVKLLWKVTENPTVLRVALVFFPFMLVWNTCYVFTDNYLSSRFDADTFQTSIAMLILGAALIFSSAVLVAALAKRFSKNVIVAGAAVVMILSIVLFLCAPSPTMASLALVPLAMAFAVGFPTLLSMFSLSVDKMEQGWVMGVSTALWTSGAGLSALIGGELMSISIRVPFLVSIAAAALALLLIATAWRSADVRSISGKEQIKP